MNPVLPPGLKSFDLSGRTALITGSSAGIGFALARGLAGAGARVILNAMGVTKVFFKCADGSEGWPEMAPFDAILVTAAMPGIPRPLLEQLAPDGRLVAPIGEDELQTLVRISRSKGSWREEYFGECRFVKMTGKHGFKD